MDNHPSPRFSMSDFKKWLSQQSDVSDFFDIKEEEEEHQAKHANLVGSEAKPRVSKHKLMERIESDEGEAETVIDDFIENGGVVSDLSGKNLLIEVDSGSFYIPRFCVKLLRNDD